MVVEVDVLVGGEERVEVGFVQRVRVSTLRTEDHEIGDVYDTHAQLGDDFAQERRGGDDFERNFHADTNENDVCVLPTVCACELPDTGACDTVPVCFFGT